MLVPNSESQILEMTARRDQLADEGVHMCPVTNIELYTAGILFAMFSDEVIQSILSATNCNDLGAFLNQAAAHGTSNTRRCTDHENMFVRERHYEGGLL